MFTLAITTDQLFLPCWMRNASHWASNVLGKLFPTIHLHCKWLMSQFYCKILIKLSSRYATVTASQNEQIPVCSHCGWQILFSKLTWYYLNLQAQMTSGLVINYWSFFCHYKISQNITTNNKLLFLTFSLSRTQMHKKYQYFTNIIPSYLLQGIQN